MSLLVVVTLNDLCADILTYRCGENHEAIMFGLKSEKLKVGKAGMPPLFVGSLDPSR